MINPEYGDLVLLDTSTSLYEVIDRVRASRAVYINGRIVGLKYYESLYKGDVYIQLEIVNEYYIMCYSKWGVFLTHSPTYRDKDKILSKFSSCV